MADKYLKTADAEWYRQRITGVMICVVAAFAVLLLRLIYLQVIRGDDYRLLSLNNRIRLQSLDAPRGLIYDRNGDVLAGDSAYLTHPLQHGLHSWLLILLVSSTKTGTQFWGHIRSNLLRSLKYWMVRLLE